MGRNYNFSNGQLRGIISPSFDTDETKELFSSLDILLDHPDHETLLDGRNRIEKVPVKFNNETRHWVIKYFHNKGLYKKLVYLFRSSKAERSYLRAEELLKKGFGTPRPIGCVEEKGGAFMTQSYYVTEFLDFDFDTRSYFRGMEHAVGLVPAEIFYKSLGLFARELHNQGLYHKDFTDGNILVCVQDAKCKFYLVDLNRLIIKKRIGTVTGIKGIVKLNFPVEYSRLLIKGYCGDEYRKTHYYLYKILRSVHLFFRDAKKPLKRFRRWPKQLFMPPKTQPGGKHE
jgi:Lipopolysaccharide kinase (Kdo/WaaP) family